MNCGIKQHFITWNIYPFLTLNIAPAHVAQWCEFGPWLRPTFFPVYFRLSPLQKHVRKVVGGFGKKSCVSTGVRKPGNTHASPTAMI